ncbi:hypothetical protein Poly51_24920 [Rubripirellula tenax]|uniref:Matrixin n=1 Tax=Rubripirellula tenax TaxID=2528015 RepID=A0A5C6F8X1_9BACT|nr:hypothetical protein [Rubripirellula tenax]TWU56576.1 hypothetical protein Poly51_24920 [Rubripirellula tenax]
MNPPPQNGSPLLVRFLAALLLFGVADAAADDVPVDLPQIQLVLLTPADVEPPPGYRERLTQIANYTDKFFQNWMARQGYPPNRKSLFTHDDDGDARVLVLRGKQNAASGIYDRPSLVNEVFQTAIPQYSIPRHLHVWWIHVYLGPDREYTDYRGSGDAAGGGSSVARYSTMPGKIDLAKPMMEGFHETYTLKGIIHELGHALGLPHMGPRKQDAAGNTLMGPNQFEWKRIVGRPEPRTYLSQASAAMLWRHPLFSGSTEQRQRRPMIVVENLECEYDQAKDSVFVRGRLSSDVTAHSVVVIDHSAKTPSEYWQQHYTARLQPDGAFSVEVTHPMPAPGTLKIIFCFDNGAVSGTTGELGFSGAIERPYEFEKSRIVFR